MSQVSFAQRLAGASKVLAIFVVLALFAAAVLVFDRGSEDRTVTVDFPQTIALYEGSEVRVLGVPVGTVDKLQPRGDVVRATITYDADVKLPDDVRAVIVSPAIVGDRFVQFSPAYDGGEVLADNARLGSDRTAVPVELDEVYQSLDDLAVALGPDGANKDGALDDLVAGAADQLDGQGAQLNETLRNFGGLSNTLADNSDELFGGVRQISDFVAMLERNDAAVRAFNDNTADVAEVLEAEREDLAATLGTLATALTSVEGLVRDNRTTLRTNIANLRTVAETLAARQGEFGEITVGAPVALSNLALAYNGFYGTLDTLADLPGTITQYLSDPQLLICSLVGGVPGDGGLCDTLGGLLGNLGLGNLIPSTEPGAAPGAATDPTSALSGLTGALPRATVASSDSDLAALLGVTP